MSKPATTPPAASHNRLPRLRWHWRFGDAFGDSDSQRLLGLLSALLDTPALGKAAAGAGMSYRAAWGLLRRCETELGLTLVDRVRGRGTCLTPLGESLVAVDSAAQLALQEVHGIWETRMRGLVEPALPRADTPPERLRVIASHDVVLADWLEHGRDVPFDMTWRGSEEALAALGRGEYDVAGFHVPEAWSSAQLIGWLNRWLKPRLHVCVPLMRRRQGLVVARGNPLGIASLADVARQGARLVNRQRGSATRSLIDQLLNANGIDGRDIDGYGHEEFTHDAVAATVASGQADAGLAVEAVAARYDLDFVPLLSERYGLATRAAVLESEPGRALLARVAGNTFRQRLLAMPGYEALPSVAAVPWEAFLAG